MAGTTVEVRATTRNTGESDVDAVVTQHNLVITDLETIRALVDTVRTAALTGPLGNPGFAIDTNFDIQNGNAFDARYDGLLFTVASGVTWDTGTTFVLAEDTWGAAVLSIDSDGTTAYVDWGTADQASEAAAIATLSDVTPSGEVVCGYVTVLTDSGATWTAGTDALQGGTGGGPSDDTNYYNHSNPDGLVVSAAVAAAGLTAAEVNRTLG